MSFFDWLFPPPVVVREESDLCGIDMLEHDYDLIDTVQMKAPIEISDSSDWYCKANAYRRKLIQTFKCSKCKKLKQVIHQNPE